MTVGPTVAPTRRASTPNSRIVASSTSPPCFDQPRVDLARLGCASATSSGGSFHATGTVAGAASSSVTSISSSSSSYSPSSSSYVRVFVVFVFLLVFVVFVFLVLVVLLVLPRRIRLLLLLLRSSPSSYSSSSSSSSFGSSCSAATRSRSSSSRSEPGRSRLGTVGDLVGAVVRVVTARTAASSNDRRPGASTYRRRARRVHDLARAGADDEQDARARRPRRAR